jgi:glutamate synthase (NADPH/NADH) small chain
MSETIVKAAFPGDRLETQITDYKPPLTAAQAVAEATRCLMCYDAPCIAACPTEINIPQFIKRIEQGNLKGAAKTILESNILGHSCARVCPVEVLCAGSCVYNEKEEPPIQIGKLQRYATEFAYDNNIQFFKKGPETGRKIALVGGGPASLAAAHELTVLGHDVVVLEGRSFPGGLNAMGVAPYKYQAEDALKEVAYVQAIGVEIKTNVWVGRDVTFESLANEYDAVFLGIGLGPDSTLGIPGEDLPGCTGAVAWIEQMKTEAGFSLNGVQNAVVVGGGNTALDVVRELKQLGVEHVTMVYRRGEAEMSGYKHELEAAKKEGVELCYWAAPVSVEGNGKASGLKAVKTRVNAEGKLENIPGSEFVLSAELIVKATGQEKLTALVAQIPGVVTERGKVMTDRTTGQTGNPKFFAGGDCANGGKEVVNAAAEGKKAARGIHAYLLQTGPQSIEVTIK